MSFSDRVKQIRNEAKLSQAEIAEQLGMTRDAYANFEYDRIKNPNAKNPTIKAICEKFHINELWLRTGEGEMHPVRTREKEIAEMTAAMYRADENDYRYQLMKLIAQLNPDQVHLLREIVEQLHDGINK